MKNFYYLIGVVVITMITLITIFKIDRIDSGQTGVLVNLAGDKRGVDKDAEIKLDGLYIIVGASSYLNILHLLKS